MGQSSCRNLCRIRIWPETDPKINFKKLKYHYIYRDIYTHKNKSVSVWKYKIYENSLDKYFFMWSYWKLYVSYARLGVTISPKVRNNLIGHFVFKTNIYDLRLRLTVRLSWTLWCVLLWLMFCGGCWMNEVVLLFILVCFTFVITGTLLLHFFLFCLMSFSHNLYYFWRFLLFCYTQNNGE